MAKKRSKRTKKVRSQKRVKRTKKVRSQKRVKRTKKVRSQKRVKRSSIRTRRSFLKKNITQKRKRVLRGGMNKPSASAEGSAEGPAGGPAEGLAEVGILGRITLTPMEEFADDESGMSELDFVEQLTRDQVNELLIHVARIDTSFFQEQDACGALVKMNHDTANRALLEMARRGGKHWARSLNHYRRVNGFHLPIPSDVIMQTLRKSLWHVPDGWWGAERHEAAAQPEPEPEPETETEPEPETDTAEAGPKISEKSWRWPGFLRNLATIHDEDTWRSHGGFSGTLTDRNETESRVGQRATDTQWYNECRIRGEAEKRIGRAFTNGEWTALSETASELEGKFGKAPEGSPYLLEAITGDKGEETLRQHLAVRNVPKGR